jgi:predicted amidophosphoribosyltransferase
VLEPGLQDEELGFLCPECAGRSLRYHSVQCSSCKTILNFIGATEKEEKFVFTVEKCSHCYGTEDDEHMIRPVYATDHFI